MIPGDLVALINFRFSTESTVEGLQHRVAAILDNIKDITGRETQASTSGGTSDGRFIATLGSQVVELGPVNATIHRP